MNESEKMKAKIETGRNFLKIKIKKNGKKRNEESKEDDMNKRIRKIN